MLRKDKVDFIVCYNNELYLKECMKYISFLEIPDGIEIDVIGIAEADSMASAYNAAMDESNAKYKVYMHQDVFILNRNFIKDILYTFQTNENYGMIGVLGSTDFVEDANYWKKWNTGTIYACDSLKSMHIDFQEETALNMLTPVVAIDGMIMITQYDLHWKEDKFKGFDFYDISQSTEFYRLGYKVGVLYQKTPWCYHDCGHSKFEQYDKNRKIFCDEYKENGYKFLENEEQIQKKDKNHEIEKMNFLIEEKFMDRDLDSAAELIQKSLEYYRNNTKLCTLYLLYKIFLKEDEIQEISGITIECNSLQEMLDKILQYKFFLRRLEYDIPFDDCDEILCWISEQKDKQLQIAKIFLEHFVISKRRVAYKLAWVIEKKYHKELNAYIEHNKFLVLNKENEKLIIDLCDKLMNETEKMNCAEHIFNYELYRERICEWFETIETVSKIIYIASMEKELYDLYFEVILQNTNIGSFLSAYRKWILRIRKYVEERKKEPLVSVLLSVYNGENIIFETLQSVLNQTYENLQVIVVDDCSKDKSREIIDKLAEKDNRITKIYMEENVNVCKAINTAYSLANGKYIATLGHDDVWLLDKIEKQVAFMEANTEYVACFTLCDIINEKSNICNAEKAQLYQIFSQKNHSQKEWINILLYYQNVFCAPSVLLRKEYLKKDHLYNYGLLQLQDFALWIDLVLDYPVYIIQERLTLYRQFLESPSNLSAQRRDTINRLTHENTYIIKKFFTEISDEKLITYLGEHFRYPQASTNLELKCERAFSLLDRGNVNCIELFIELLENDQSRYTLEKRYNFKTSDFYKINSENLIYSPEILQSLRDANATVVYLQEQLKNGH